MDKYKVLDAYLIGFKRYVPDLVMSGSTWEIIRLEYVSPYKTIWSNPGVSIELHRPLTTDPAYLDAFTRHYGGAYFWEVRDRRSGKSVTNSSNVMKRDGVAGTEASAITAVLEELKKNTPWIGVSPIRV